MRQPTNLAASTLKIRFRISPFPPELIKSLGNIAHIKNNGRFHGQILGYIISLNLLNLTSEVSSGSAFGLSWSTDVAHALIEASFMDPNIPNFFCHHCNLSFYIC